ncbi:MAG: diguanylate cyclase [Methylomonas sp.]|nr:diguanylate cyclase [Methylomonas sp.]
MSFFKDKNEANDVWQQKYYQLLEKQDDFEKECKANEDLLAKTVVRFALAIKGFDKALDPHIDRIRNLLKTGLKTESLQAEVEAFTNTLMQLEDKQPNPDDSALLFDFLDRCYPDRAVDLKSLRGRYNKGELGNEQALFLQLAELVAVTNSSPGEDVELKPADYQALRLYTRRLLESIDSPENLSEEVKQLTDRLQHGEALMPIFDDMVSLLLSFKKHTQAEQRKMAEFLAKLTDELAELGLKAEGVNVANENAMQNRANLNKDVAAQMLDLQNSSAAATQLEPLKQLVNIRLQKITQQIQSHNQKEQQERQENKKAFSNLVQQIQVLEAETETLQSQLELAQQQATRDPLTHLPNRLALELRLADELARVRRHGTPLTLAIWDIDYFKKVNDTYGHKAGDKALAIIGKLLLNRCRETDFIGRFGGEEFVMLFPETDGKVALKLTEKLRAVIEGSGFNASGNRVVITVSCGLTEYRDGEGAESLFERADQALYRAKQKGRNRCELFEMESQ